MAKYTVVHPVRHNGKLHDRGTHIDLNEADASRLQDLGAVAPAGAIVEVPVPERRTFTVLSNAELEKRTKQQIAEYALSGFNLTLEMSLTKEEMILAIGNATPRPDPTIN